MTNNSNHTVCNKAAWYQAITGKPIETRPQLDSERNKLVARHATKINSFEDREVDFSEFAQAFCAVLDMYEAYLDAACDLNDAEIDELCFRTDMPREGFDRYVRIAKIQKQVPFEIELGLDNGKKWAVDPTLLQ